MARLLTRSSLLTLALLASLSALPLTTSGVALPACQARAFLFVSPSTAENLSLDDAVAAMHSPQQHHARRQVTHILRQAAAGKHRSDDALGDWSDGVENSLLVELSEAASTAGVRYSAARLGLLHKQKSVLLFVSAADGPDLVHQIDVGRSTLAGLRQALDAGAIKYRTLVPRGKGHRVVVFDQGGKLRASVRRFACRHKAEVRETRGQGEFLGDDTRERAAQRFKQVIRDHERGAKTSSAARLWLAGGSAEDRG